MYEQDACFQNTENEHMRPCFFFTLVSNVISCLLAGKFAVNSLLHPFYKSLCLAQR